MIRRTLAPRPGWQAKVEALGLIWHSTPERPYWNESAAYIFTSAQIATLEAATAELYRLYLAGGQAAIDRDLLGHFGIPAFAHSAIRAAWDAEPPALNHGRFDLGWNGTGDPKLFEFNADTPTGLLEAAVIQWAWKQDCFPGHDQFTSLHETLIARWRDIGAYLAPAPVHFVHADGGSGEDAVTVAYLRDTAREAGLFTRAIAARDIGWDGRGFVDLERDAMRSVFHLYPWEWLLAEAFGQRLIDTLHQTHWIEPIWKMLFSNKAMLALLWELFPGHPNLLETQYAPLAGDQVRKPLFAREGANVSVLRDGSMIAETGGGYGAEGFVHQRLYPLPAFDGNYPVLGCWIVDGAPCGLGVREDGLITTDTARFVPHLIEG